MHKKREQSAFRSFASMLAAIGAGAALAAACSFGGVQAEPDELLLQAISGLSGTDDFRFAGTTAVTVGGLPLQREISFQGTVTGHNRLTMTFDREAAGAAMFGSEAAEPVVFSRRENEWVLAEAGSPESADLLLAWNPLHKLEQLGAMKRRVESRKDDDESRLTVLTVTPDDASTTEAARSRLAGQAAMLDTDKLLAGWREKLALSEREAARMKGELEQSVQRARQLVEEADSSLKASSVYRIWIDRVSRLPKKMQVETEMTYTSAGAPKTETTRTDYTFSDYRHVPDRS